MSIPFRSKVASKQIHITTEPAPRNLTESRLILKALQKFGEVVYFYNMKYEPQLRFRNSGRSVLAIFESEDSANAAISASPLKVPLSEGPSSSIEPSSGIPGNKTNKSKNSKNDNSREQQGTTLECTINRSDYDHADAVRKNPYYNTFTLTTNSLEFQDLTRKETNGGIPLRQHADCFTGRKKPDPFRFQQRMLGKNQHMRVDSLMGLWRQGQEKERMEKVEAREEAGSKGKEGKKESIGKSEQDWTVEDLEKALGK